MPGFGGGFGGGFGHLPFGGLAADFNLIGAVAIDFQTVDLTFDRGIDPGPPTNSAGSYTFDNGLEAIAVVVLTSSKVRIFTTTQAVGVLYTVTTVDTLVSDIGTPIVNRQAQFVGIGSSPQAVVSELQARTDCVGLSIFLSWTTPPFIQCSPPPDSPIPVSHMKIARRTKQWPFDFTDPGYDLLWDSDTLIHELEDTGIAWPLTETTAAVNKGALTIQVTDASGYGTGDSLRVEVLTGERTFDILEVFSTTPTSITFTTNLTNSYPAGARVAKSTPLSPQTYYYYVVAILNPCTGEYDLTDDSRAFALSIDLYNSVDWFRKNTPSVNLERDAKPLSENGGDGFLQKWFQVMGCWLNLMRGNANAVQLLNDPDQSPFNALTAQNEQLGIVPEGLSYDFDIVRRPLTSLIFVYKRKGTCPGIVETVSMFTKWASVCVQFGDHECVNGSSDLTTWDGSSLELWIDTPAYTGTWNFELYDNETGSGKLVDMSQVFPLGQWDQGEVIGSLGDIACLDVTLASENEITTKAPIVVTRLSVPANPGDTVLTVFDTTGLRPGLMIQLADVSGIGGAEIHQITAVDPALHTITLEPFGIVAGPFAADSIVSIQKSVIRPELGYGKWATTAAAQVITFPGAMWVEDQWINHKLLTADNVKHNIVSNTVNTVTVDGAAPPAAGVASIAWDFDPIPVTYAARKPTVHYRIMNGVHTFLWEPTFDLYARGTLYDPLNPLWQGSGLNLYGVWAPNDVGVYILGKIPLFQGAASTVVGSTFTLDPTQPAPADHTLRGTFLNPNQNQEQVFEILDNDATTLTVLGDVSSLTVAGQMYYILTPRDKNRFQRLTQRLRNEFTDTDVRIHVLFV